MSELLNSQNFGEKIYNKFPEVYRRDDQFNNYALKRYIETAGEGFKCVIDEINGITDLKDSDKIPSKFLPELYSSHGLYIFNGIPELYLRNLVPILNPLFSRKGSMSVISYLCSVVSGVICTVSTEHFEENNRVDVLIDMDSNTQINFPSIEQLRRILKEFIPFYCNTTLVFSYVFMDTITLTLRDINHKDIQMFEDEEQTGLKIDEVLEDDVYIRGNENCVLNDVSYGENSNFLNSPILLLTNNIFLNSWNGYDTITVNGVTTIKTYEV